MPVFSNKSFQNVFAVVNFFRFFFPTERLGAEFGQKQPHFLVFTRNRCARASAQNEPKEDGGTIGGGDIQRNNVTKVF